MFVKPVLIIGAPRSGTSMLQKVLRNHPIFWSLPSESDLIWDTFCHPELRAWESESLTAEALTPEIREKILAMFEDYARPATYWNLLERGNLIWGFRRMPLVRKLMRLSFRHLMPRLSFSGNFGKQHDRRLLDKTASNSLRLGFVNAVFPDSRIIYPCRDGRNNLNSLINAWRHPNRFFTYDVPVELAIPGYQHKRWKFVLPPGWRDYTHRPLHEICAFQWRACHDAMLAEIEKPQYSGRVFRLKLEEMAHDPTRSLAALAEFLELPFDDYFAKIARELPIVNSPDNDISEDKWLGENRALIEQVLPLIAPTMNRLGYRI